MTTKQKHFIEEVGRCELCGSKRNLQLHHAIPMVCENEFAPLDVEDNWLCVCGSCHAKLTPKNLLVRYGLAKTRERNKQIERYSGFLETVLAEIEGGATLSASDMLYLFEQFYGEGVM